jgi:hypothetical protein
MHSEGGDEDEAGDDYDLNDSFINDSEETGASQPVQEGHNTQDSSEKMAHIYRQSVFMSPDKNPLFSKPSTMHAGNAKFKLAFNRRTPTPSPERPSYNPGEDLGDPYSPRTRADEEYFERLARREAERQQRAEQASTATARQIQANRAVPERQRGPLSPPFIVDHDGMSDDDFDANELDLALAAVEAAENQPQPQMQDTTSTAAVLVTASDCNIPKVGTEMHAAAQTTEGRPEGAGPKGYLASTLLESSDDEDDFVAAVAVHVQRQKEQKEIKQGREAAGAGAGAGQRRGRAKKVGRECDDVTEHSSGGANSPPRTQPLSAVDCAVLVGTGELKTGGQIVSRLRNVCQLHVNVTNTKGMSFIISHRVAALRLRFGDVPGWHKNADIVERIRNLRNDYVRPYIIIEQDVKVSCNGALNRQRTTEPYIGFVFVFPLTFAYGKA